MKKNLFPFILASIPFVAVCLSVSLWDRIDPLVFGLPFNVFWLIAWIPLTSICLFGVYRLKRHLESREVLPSRKAGSK